MIDLQRVCSSYVDVHQHRHCENLIIHKDQVKLQQADSSAVDSNQGTN